MSAVKSVIDVPNWFLFKVTRTIEGQSSVTLIFNPTKYWGKINQGLVFGFKSLLTLCNNSFSLEL